MRKRELDVAVGSVFQGRYRVLEELSRGGFGVVYKGEQLATGQHVAIKCLERRGDTEAETQEHLARFRREATLCGQLHHPNIIRLIDTGQSNGDIFYTVFEYVPGDNLQQVLAREGALQPAEAKHLMAQVLDAVSCAHAQGIVHRDLKPGNIMIAGTGARRNALVLDFGIGSLLHEIRDRDQDSTSTNVSRIGTPAYASPEQLRGEDSDETTDIYSFGLMFLECLTGQRAIPGDTIAAVIHAQLDQAPVDIPYALNGHPLERLLRHATAKNPANRRMSAAELLTALVECDVSDVAVPRAQSRTGVAMSGPEDLVTLTTGISDAQLAIAEVERDRSESRNVTTGERVRSSESARDTSSSDVLRSTPRRHRRILRAADAERRQLTVVACAIDITSEDIDELDVEEYEHLLAAHTDHCAGLARQRGAYIARATDGQVILYFGYPKARGRDVARAARSALELINTFAQTQKDGSAGLRGSSELRIGIHTGLVLIQTSGTTAVPKVSVATPRLAGQLSAIAPGNSAVVSDATRQLIRDLFDYESMGQKRLSGMRTPAQVYHLRASHDSSSINPSSVAQEAIPLIGRVSELARLHHLWRECGKGRGHAVLITGNAGIGKTRLLQEFGRQLIDQPFTWLDVQCIVDHENNALQPISELIEQIIGSSTRSDGRDKLARLDEIASHYGLEPSDAVPPLALLVGAQPSGKYSLLDIAPARQRALILSAVSSLLLEMAARKPLILVLENLHWADPSTLEFLDSLLEELPFAPVFILLTARADFAHTWPASSLTTLELTPLSSRDARRIATAVSQGYAFEEHTLLDIIEHTDGVPLFIAETVHAIIAQDALERVGESYRLRRPLADLDIPCNLRGLLTARLDDLDKDARAVLQLASVLGREFMHAHLRAACWLDELALESALSRLSGRGPLQRRRRISGDLFVFKQALVHEAAYQSLPKSTRVAYHGNLADVLELDFPDVGQSRSELLARLHAGAGRIARALAYARTAALGALQQCANEEAIAHAQQAIGWARKLPDEFERAEAELGFHAIVAPALLGTRGHGNVEFTELARRAEELIVLVGDSPAIAQTLWGLWLHHYVRSEYLIALGYAERQLATAKSLGDSHSLLIARMSLIATQNYLGRYLIVEKLLHESLALYDPDQHADLTLTFGHDVRTTLAGTLAKVQWATGALAEARHNCERALRWAHELSHPISECFGFYFCMYIALWDGDYEGVRALADEMSVLAEQRGLQQWSLIAHMFDTAAAGDAEGGRRALATFRSAGQSIGQTFWLATIARSEAVGGDYQAALSLLDEAIELAESTSEEFYLAPLYTQVGRYRFAARPDRWDTAADSLRKAVDTADRQGASMFTVGALTQLARVLGTEQSAEAELVKGRLRVMVEDLDDGSMSQSLVEARSVLGGTA